MHSFEIPDGDLDCMLFYCLMLIPDFDGFSGQNLKASMVEKSWYNCLVPAIQSSLHNVISVKPFILDSHQLPECNHHKNARVHHSKECALDCSVCNFVQRSGPTGNRISQCEEG